MKGAPLLTLGLTMLLLGSGCHPAVLSSSEMQQKFFSSLKNSTSGEDSALRSAHYYNLVGRVDLALNELNHAIALYPNNVRLLNAMGGCYDRLGNYPQAREMYEKALAQDSGNTLVRNNLGYSRYLSGDLTGSETLFKKILADNPNDTLACNNLGLVWCRQGKESQALRLWQKSDGDIQAREKLQQILAYLGKPVDQTTIAVAPAPAKPQINPLACADGALKQIKIHDNSSITAADVAVAPVRISRANLPPAAALEVPVKIEEVPMVVQNASYTQSSADSKVSAPCPPQSMKSAPEKVRQWESAALDPDLDLLSAEETPPQSRRYYRRGYWHGNRKPKVIICSPQELSKTNSIKKCLHPESTFQPQNASAKKEMAVY
jgi:tetratricopeptide (TPR) repeat protein